MSERAPEKLTGREQEVAALMAKGLTNAEIAERLGVSFATAKWYASQVLAKLEIDSRGQVGPQQGIGLARKHRALWPLGLLGKLLAIAAAVVPIGGLAVFAGLVFASREGDTVSQPRSYQSPSAIARGAAAQPPAPSINTPAKQPQGCDWAAGQGHINDGPLDHSGCDFSGVDFGERGIMWNMADLHGANLSSAIIAGTFANADFSGADLRGVRFVQSVFGRTNFSGADLTGANFTDSILTDGDFTGATCPDGSNSSSHGGTCLGTKGLRNMPATRSFAAGAAMAGKTAPPFRTVSATGGSPIELGNFSGKPLVLVWTASWCFTKTRCDEVFSTVREAALKHPDVAFLALSLDNTASEALADAVARGFPFPVAVDEDMAIAAKYHVVGAGTYAVVDAEGNVAATLTGSGQLVGLESVLAALGSRPVN